MTLAPECSTELLINPEEEFVYKTFHASRAVLDMYPSDCGTKFYQYLVGNKVYLDPQVSGTGERHKSRCPVCARRDAMRHARKAIHRFFAFEWSNMWGIVLTAPDSFVDSMVVNDDAYLKKRMKELRALGHKYMKKVHPEVPYMMVFHHWGSDDPTGAPHFHLHITALCARYEFGESNHELSAKYEYRVERGLCVEEIEPYVDVASCRDVWAEILGCPSVDLHYQFMSRITKRWTDKDGEVQVSGGWKKILHWLAYCYRYYIQDVERMVLKSEQDLLSEEEKQGVEWHNRDWGTRVGNYGAFSNRKRKYFVKEKCGCDKQVEDCRCDTVENRLLTEKKIRSVKFTPEGEEIKCRSFGECTRDGVREDQLLIHQRVEYLDEGYHPTINSFTRYLEVPKSIMRWDEYHNFKKVKDG